MNIFLSPSLLFFTFAPLPSILTWLGLWKFGGLKKHCRPSLQPQMELVFVFACGLAGVCVCCVCVGGGMGTEREMIESREREGFDA